MDHYMLPLPSALLRLSSNPSLSNEREALVTQADWQQRQRWKDEKSEGAAGEGKGEGMRGEEKKRVTVKHSPF